MNASQRKDFHMPERRSSRRSTTRRPSGARKTKATQARRKKGPKQERSKLEHKGTARIHLLSDSTGNLPRHIVSTLLTQFPEGAFTLEMHNFLDDPDRLDHALDQARRRPGLVFHALVDPEAKVQVQTACAEGGLAERDLTGPLVEFLAEQTGVAPQPSRSRLHRLDREYRRRIDALEYTVAHDDGQGLRDLGSADVILTGVSRTSKTPTSVFLAEQGYRVANVPLAPQLDPPTELMEADPRRVVGLWIDPDVLLEIRIRRWREFGGTPRSGYTDPQKVEDEVAWSRRLFRRQPWASLNVTNQAIEETAGRVIGLLNYHSDEAI